jgi:3-methylcrotonyl-CoA carboxylase alpha subunit
VIKCLVSNGDCVEAGQSLLVLEAMKMEHTLRAAAASIVTVLHCTESQMVQPDQLLVELEPV